MTAVPVTVTVTVAMSIVVALLYDWRLLVYLHCLRPL